MGKVGHVRADAAWFPPGGSRSGRGWLYAHTVLESADFAAFPTDHRETGRDQPIAEPGAEGGTVSISVGAVRLFNVTRVEVTPGYSVGPPQ